MKDEQIENLKRQIACIDKLKLQHYECGDFVKWERKTERILARIFGQESKNLKEFSQLIYYPMVFGFDDDDSDFQQAYISGLNTARTYLEDYIEELEEEIEYRDINNNQNLKVEILPVGVYGRELIDYWLKNINKVKDDINFLNTIEEYLRPDKAIWVYGIEPVTTMIKEIDNEKYQKLLLQGMISYFEEPVNGINNFSSYECCIKYLLEYYGIFEQVFGLDKQFIELLADAIRYSGDSNDASYAFRGLDMVRKYIGVLREELVIGILNRIDEHLLRVKQIKVILDYSSIAQERKEILKAYYIDMWYLERNYREIIDHIIRTKYQEEYTNINPSNIDEKIVFIHKTKSDDYIVKFKIINEDRQSDQVKWVLEDSHGGKEEILVFRVNYQYKYITVILDETNIYRHTLDNSSKDKCMTKDIKDRIESRIGKVNLEKDEEKLTENLIQGREVKKILLKGNGGQIMNVERKLQVFVSSTYTDLKKEREKAVQVILDTGHIPAGMELFRAGKEQMETIKRWIDESDVYMLILGGRYGSIEDKSKKSYTHLEYEYAISQQKEVFAIVLEDNYLQDKMSAGQSTYKEIMEQDYPEKYKGFKTEVKNKICYLVENEAAIENRILKQMSDYGKDTKLLGWVRGTILNEVIEENKKLKDCIEKNMK